MQIKPNVALWVALAIPAVVVLAVAILIYWPQSGLPEPKHNFAYILQDYGDGYSYSVEDQHLVRAKEDAIKPFPSPVSPNQTHFFLHNVTTNESKELTFEEAVKLTLDSNLTAPDGYELKRGSGNGGVFPFFFDNSNYDNQYLTLKNRAVEMKIKKSADYSYNTFQFIGWVVE